MACYSTRATSWCSAMESDCILHICYWKCEHATRLVRNEIVFDQGPQSKCGYVEPKMTTDQIQFMGMNCNIIQLVQSQ